MSLVRHRMDERSLGRHVRGGHRGGRRDRVRRLEDRRTASSRRFRIRGNGRLDGRGSPRAILEDENLGLGRRSSRSGVLPRRRGR